MISVQDANNKNADINTHLATMSHKAICPRGRQYTGDEATQLLYITAVYSFQLLMTGYYMYTNNTRQAARRA